MYFFVGFFDLDRHVHGLGPCKINLRLLLLLIRLNQFLNKEFLDFVFQLSSTLVEPVHMFCKVKEVTKFRK